MKKVDIDKIIQELDPVEFEDYYRSHNLEDVYKKYNILHHINLMKILNFFNIPKKTKEEIQQTKTNTSIKNFGSIEKLREHNREKYKNTCLEKYGVDSANKTKEVQAKKENSCLKSLGVKHPAQSKEVMDKMKKTSIERYGVEHYSSTKECHEKVKNTKNEKYGDPKYTNVEKMKQTIIEKYGSMKEFYNVRNKISSNTKLEKYGDPKYNNREKYNNTMIEKYGSNNVYVVESILGNRRRRYKYDGISFDSSWEVAFYIWSKDHELDIKRESKKILYYTGDKKHYYLPDFEIDQQLFEIKSNFEYSRTCDEKKRCMSDNDVILIMDDDIQEFIDYVEDKYGKNYILQFKNKKTA